MNSQFWLEAFRRQLLQQALPPQHVERLVRELHDHLADAQEDSRMDANRHDSHVEIGNPVDIANAAAQEYCGRTFRQRHPIALRLALTTLTAGLLLFVGLLSVGRPLSAGGYVFSARILDQDGNAVGSPRVVIGPRQEATITIQDSQSEYCLMIKAADKAAKESYHTLELRVIETDSQGRQSTLYAPRLSFDTDQEACVDWGQARLRVKATAAL